MPINKIIEAKLKRLQEGKFPRFMDLFSGCGGISLGFVSAGFELVASIESDPSASETYGFNFVSFGIGLNKKSYIKSRNIMNENPASIFSDLGIVGAVDEQVDVLVGGPPCQAFARIGRAKLRAEAYRRADRNADDAYLFDDRVNLWHRYIYYIKETKPIALLMENVPDILNHGGNNIVEEVCEKLEHEGYLIKYTLLNASWFGVPQTRERMFLIGVHKDLGQEAVFPLPTHYTELPPGYRGTRAVARKLIPELNTELFQAEQRHHWIRDPIPSDELHSTTTASEALADLPPIFALELLDENKIERGKKDTLQSVAYTSIEPTTAWSRLMRRWPRFETSDHTTGHVIRYLPRDYKIFRLMEEGWQYPEIWRFVEQRRNQLLHDLLQTGTVKEEDATSLQELTNEWTLPYDPSKFPNKWWKLQRDKPVRTLMAHLGKDSYSHIHYDSEQARTISVREAARLQSFPDGFVLYGNMNSAFKQIGNAVPPLVAYALAREMRSMIGCPTMPDLRSELLSK